MSLHTHITKVLAVRGKTRLAVCLGLLTLPSILKAQTSPDKVHRGPAEAVYLELSNTELDPARVFKVRDVSLDRSAIHITLDDGTIAFTKDVLGKITGAFFEGDGEVLLAPPNEVERKSMSLFTGMAILEERFSTAYFRFNDNTAAALQPGLRAPDQPFQFVAEWNETARTLARTDAMRLLASFSWMLPSGKEDFASAKPGKSGTGPDPDDRMLHARLQGSKLGAFDILFDSTAAEQIEVGQSKTAEDATVYYDVWTSFSTTDVRHKTRNRQDMPTNTASQSESWEDPILVRSYAIDAQVKPPKELDAEVNLQLDVKRGGSRFLVFELSRFLQIHSVEADGIPAEFIQNPAVEGTRLARSGNDLVAVILPQAGQRGQRINLRFHYGGDVIEEAGKGLLYVGARGNWYPHRGAEMADYDLTFHYPQGWTLLATGKFSRILERTATAAQEQSKDSNSPEEVSRFVSERPMPVAGFNLGKYVRAEARSGNVVVATYATNVVEKEFPKAAEQSVQIEPKGFSPRPAFPSIPTPVVAPPPPSPARNAAAVAESTARFLDFYTARFGPFPYSKLDLTQMPGTVSQGWPGLIFLSSYAFLTREEREQIHMDPVIALIDQVVPAHEAAHQWWGDLITWATYRDQWFSEGLANYCSLMNMEAKNPTEFRLVMNKYRNDLEEKNRNGASPKDDGPVTLGTRLLSSKFPEGYEAISYGRGTWLFYMLRSMLLDGQAMEGRHSNRTPGDEPFVRALRKIRERYSEKAITTAELLDVFAEELPASLRYEGKASLDWFLNGWVNGTSLPRFELQSVKFTPRANAILVTGTIRQKDAPDDLVTSVPLYAVTSGKSSVLLGRVFAEGPESSFHLLAPAGTHKILIDPHETILTNLKQKD